jgi:hypothetical protein
MKIWKMLSFYWHDGDVYLARYAKEVNAALDLRK